jgi:hypothetical protein
MRLTTKPLVNCWDAACRGADMELIDETRPETGRGPVRLARVNKLVT